MFDTKKRNVYNVVFLKSPWNDIWMWVDTIAFIIFYVM